MQLTSSIMFRGAQLAALALVLGGCNTSEFLDVNQTPNNPLSVSPSALLNGVEVTTGFAVGNDLGRVADLLVQHTAGIANQPRTYDTYLLRGNYDNQWNNELYGGSLINAQQIINLTQEASPVYAGYAKILKAYNFALATDLWGDIPYSDALQGNLAAPNLQPRFDKQEDIYKGNAALGIQSLFDLVREGLADLDKPSALRPGTDDLIYFRGSVTTSAAAVVKWKKFGNTLLLKLANTISKKEPALAASVINEVVAKGTGAYMTDNSDDAEVPFGTTVGNQNPFYAYNFVNRPDDQMLSQRFLDSLNRLKDPRLPQFFTTVPATAGIVTPFGRFAGYDNGGTAAVPVRGSRSRYASYVVGASGEAPVRLVTNFQRAFILAEAVLTLPGVTVPGQTAQSLFEAGIRASMAKAGLSAVDITTYFAANPGVVTLAGPVERQRNQIITQKWIAWTGNGYEAYNDFRRTGYPKLALVTNPSSESPVSIPARLYYPNVEITSNAANIPTPQPLTTVKVWWAE
ncbi:SusD/RagB family nutrient-binding outer membrane lipoprotein [Hymenobacter sp.]|uniref:SusD/RagB family nutrient-binding outer membrane lipoprotein n=1 Tax=Hymenobacter sp. TaxID=1898978 RepID=UPI00286A85A0|nr:SusD/RagB family nutrient-binding outer membrane lipoprotein [Hymenobacter sp.]